MNTVVVDLKRSKLPRAQPWRWVALSADSVAWAPRRKRWRRRGNNRKLATSGEWYEQRAHAIHAAHLLFGANTDVYLRQPGLPDIVLREAPQNSGDTGEPA